MPTLPEINLPPAEQIGDQLAATQAQARYLRRLLRLARERDEAERLSAAARSSKATTQEAVIFDARADVATGLVGFTVAANAKPGNASPALARLLVGIDHRRRERAAAELASEQITQSEPQSENP